MKLTSQPALSPAQLTHVEAAVRRTSPSASPTEVARATASIAQVLSEGAHDLNGLVAFVLGSVERSRDVIALSEAFAASTPETVALREEATRLEAALGVNFAQVEQRFAAALTELASALPAALPAALNAAFPPGSVAATDTGYRVTVDNARTVDFRLKTRLNGETTISAVAEFDIGSRSLIGDAEVTTSMDVETLARNLPRAAYKALLGLTTAGESRSSFETVWKAFLDSKSA